MNEGITWNAIFSVAATLFGILASALMGMAIAQLKGINAHLGEMNGKLFTHLTDATNHGAGFARMEEQVANLTQTVRIAHDRIDAVKAGRG